LQVATLQFQVQRIFNDLWLIVWLCFCK